MQTTGSQRFLKFSIALIVFGLVLGIAPQVQADTLTMCITDVAPSPTNENCNQGSTSGHTGSIFLTSNGSTITSSLTGAASLTTDFTSPDLLGLLGVVGPFTINIAEGNVNESPDNALDVTFNVSSTAAADGKHLWLEFATGTSFTGGARLACSAPARSPWEKLTFLLDAMSRRVRLRPGGVTCCVIRSVPKPRRSHRLCRVLPAIRLPPIRSG